MANVLNLALKKDVFEGIMAKTTNEIPIKKNDWWKKRLMDLDTGRFKYFDVASVSSGSSDKFEYVIDHIEDRGNFYVIVVVLPEDDVEDNEPEVVEEEKEVIEPEQVNPEVIEPEVIEPEVVENVEEEVHIKPNVTFDTIREDIVVTKEGTAKVDEYSELKQSVISLLDVFCGLDNNFVVNMPFVTIRNNGHIVGTQFRLRSTFDADVRIDYKKQEFPLLPGMSNDHYINIITSYMKRMMISNFVFINRKASGFKYGDDGRLVFVLYATGKRRYLLK